MNAEVKWWVNFAADSLAILGFLFVLFSLPAPHVEVYLNDPADNINEFFTIYGYQTARIWGWVFPQIVFIGGFLAYRQATAADKIYKAWILYEVIFGLFTATVSPTIALQHYIHSGTSTSSEAEAYIYFSSIRLRTGAYVLMFGYFIGAFAALLRLILVMREGDYDNTYQSSSTGYQTLPDVQATNQRYSNYQQPQQAENAPAHYPQQGAYQNIGEGTQYQQGQTDSTVVIS